MRVAPAKSALVPRGVSTAGFLGRMIDPGADVLVTIAGDVCATLLIVAPWTFGFGGAATWNAWLSGAAIAISAFAALTFEPEWEGVTSLGLGLWVVLSPSVIGFVLK
jgi:hypothetical protein